MAEISEPANARSRRTRARLLDATRELLEEGSGGFTVAAVAERAGVSRAAAYLHFESRADLVGSLFDHLADRNRLAESLAPVWQAPDAISAVDEWARHLARYHVPMIPIDRAIQQLEGSDVEIARHRRRVGASQLETCRRLAAWLDADGVLAPEWTRSSAADALYALIATDVFERLLTDRKWSQARLAESLAVLLRRAFTTTVSRRVAPARPRATPARKGTSTK